LSGWSAFDFALAQRQIMRWNHTDELKGSGRGKSAPLVISLLEIPTPVEERGDESEYLLLPRVKVGHRWSTGKRPLCSFSYKIRFNLRVQPSKKGWLHIDKMNSPTGRSTRIAHEYVPVDAGRKEEVACRLAAEHRWSNSNVIAKVTARLESPCIWNNYSFEGVTPGILQVTPYDLPRRYCLSEWCRQRMSPTLGHI
jgi:hypothetical protein